VREDLGRCLLGNSSWTEIVGLYLDELEEKQAPAVAISLFNPADLVMGLFKAHTEGSTSYLPSLQVVAEPRPAGEAEGIVGFINWDGETVQRDPREMLDQFFEGDLFNYFLMRNFNEVWQVEDDLLAWHGLNCSAMEITGAEEPEMCSLRAEDGRLLRGRRLEETGAHPIADFLAAHQDYLEQLTSQIRNMSIGL
jgi:hypothetical protein